MANQGGALGQPPAAPPAALSPLSSTTASLLGSPNWQDTVSGYIAGQSGSQIAQSNLTGSLGSASLGMVAPQLGVSQAEAGVGEQGQLANALLGYESTGLQSQGLAQQAQTAAQQQGIERSEYGVSATQYPEQQAEAALANQNAVIGNRDAAAIGGTQNTTGNQRNVATQAQQYGWQQADIYRNQQLAALGQQSEEAGYTGQEDQFANQRAQLALAAQGQGISAQQGISQFGFGLQQLGVQASPEQYLAQIANAEGGSAQSLAGIGSQAGIIGGLGPNYASAAMGG